jgi:hypothetical protein
MRSLKQRGIDPVKEGASLANFLNLSSTEPLLASQIAVVQQVLLKLIELTAEVKQGPKKYLSPKEVSFARAEWDDRLRHFNSLLEPHTWNLHLIGWGPDGKPVFCDLPASGFDTSVIFKLIQIARAGFIDHFKKCELATCGVWFFARKRWGRFHSAKCKREAGRSTEEFKEAHRNYQQQYYRNTLSPHQDLYRKGLSPKEVRERMKTRRHNGKRR